MNLNTTYLGFKLPHPLMAGASPLVDDLDAVKRLEDAGVSAIVMHSLFEEQITREQLGTILDMELNSANSAEALSYFPEPKEFRLGPENYLEQVRRIKAAVGVPVIASLNGISPSGWLDYARLVEQAGADAIELNVYYLSTDPKESGEAVEQRSLDVVKIVKAAVKVPVAVKLSPFHSSLPHFVAALEAAGADGVVLFNRFLQPDIDLDSMETTPKLVLSDAQEFLKPLRWVAILHGRVNCSLAITSGVHDSHALIKALLAGADVGMIASAIYHKGFKQVEEIIRGLTRWMEEKEYESVKQMKGSMSQQSVAEPGAFERANYMKVLNSYKSNIK